MSYLTEDRSHPLHFDVQHRTIVEDVLIDISQVTGIVTGSFKAVFYGMAPEWDQEITITYQKVGNMVTLVIPPFNGIFAIASPLTAAPITGSPPDPVIPVNLRPTTLTTQSFAMTTNNTVVRPGDILVNPTGQIIISTSTNASDDREFEAGPGGLTSAGVITYKI